MQITIKGRHWKVTPDYRAYAERRIEKLQRYFSHLISAQLTVTEEGYRHQAELRIFERCGFDGTRAGSGPAGRAGRGAGKAGARAEAAQGEDQGPQEEERPGASAGGHLGGAPGEPGAAGRNRDRPHETQAAHADGGSSRPHAAEEPASRSRVLGAGGRGPAGRLSPGGWAGRIA